MCLTERREKANAAVPPQTNVSGTRRWTGRRSSASCARKSARSRLPQASASRPSRPYPRHPPARLPPAPPAQTLRGDWHCRAQALKHARTHYMGSRNSPGLLQHLAPTAGICLQGVWLEPRRTLVLLMSLPPIRIHCTCPLRQLITATPREETLSRRSLPPSACRRQARRGKVVMTLRCLHHERRLGPWSN